MVIGIILSSIGYAVNISISCNRVIAHLFCEHLLTKKGGMFIRRSFEEFLKLQSDAQPVPVTRDGVIDWRWLYEEAPLPSERSLIDCGTWEKPKKQKPA